MKLNNFTSDGWGHGKKSLAVTYFTQCFHFIRFSRFEFDDVQFMRGGTDGRLHTRCVFHYSMNVLFW